jgi:hypothetical protein
MALSSSCEKVFMMEFPFGNYFRIFSFPGNQKVHNKNFNLRSSPRPHYRNGPLAESNIENVTRIATQRRLSILFRTKTWKETGFRLVAQATEGEVKVAVDRWGYALTARTRLRRRLNRNVKRARITK